MHPAHGICPGSALALDRPVCEHRTPWKSPPVSISWQSNIRTASIPTIRPGSGISNDEPTIDSWPALMAGAGARDLPHPVVGRLQHRQVRRRACRALDLPGAALCHRARHPASLSMRLAAALAAHAWRMVPCRDRRLPHPGRLFRPVLSRLQSRRLGGQRRHHRLPAADPGRPDRAAISRASGSARCAGSAWCWALRGAATVILARSTIAAGIGLRRALRHRRACSASPAAPCGKSASAPASSDRFELIQYAVGPCRALCPSRLAARNARRRLDAREFIAALAYLVIGNSLISMTLLLAMIRAGEVVARLVAVLSGAAG